MFLALRELRHARLRFVMIGAIITLVAWLVFLLSGLANGLAADNAGALQRLPADYLVLQSESRSLMQRSLLPVSGVEAARQVPGVREAAPLGQMMATVQRGDGGLKIDVALLGIEPGSFVAPLLDAGSGLDGTHPDGVVVDRSLAADGVALGDSLLVQPAGQSLTVTGFTSGQTYSHAPVIFLSLARWQELRFAVSGTPGDDGYPISAIALRADSAAAARVVEALPDVQAVTRAEAIRQVPGYQQERGTLLTIQGFLVAIAAVIIAAFFYIMTLQKTAQFGVLKVLGASTAVLARALLSQVTLLTVLGCGVGALLAFGVSSVLPGAIPFALAGRLIALYGALLLVVALGGSLLSLRRIATTDALTALGRAA